MPELPEVETVVRTLAPHVTGARIAGAEVLRASTVHPLSLPLGSLAGLAVTGVRRRGKLILMDVAPGSGPVPVSAGAVPTVIAVHLRMTGRLLPRPAGSAPGPYTRWYLDLEAPDGTPQRLFFDDTRAFGTVFAATPALLEQWDFWRSLGPEPLGLDEAAFARQLRGRRTVKAALLDQRVVAGIGNIYADEALHRAGIDPRRPAGGLDARERHALLGALRDVLTLAIAQCGSSIRDYRDADGNAGAFQNSFAVYGRGGEPCRACSRPLARVRVAGRATVYCPHCQR
ncbi:MAG: bifunctional DNA-formamidopyrimidine glycosylase/DNA-(apurinic or apyrimidinic site) lyase [Desulfovibrio sp.]|nr:bifunctional DNA-formamidopyrimidine glycosylase/DNA-(apurinic or apyrimidinic site) lyase [Desulfovibrio sp.]